MIFRVESKDELPLMMDVLTECIDVGHDDINIVEGDLI